MGLSEYDNIDCCKNFWITLGDPTCFSLTPSALPYIRAQYSLSDNLFNIVIYSNAIYKICAFFWILIVLAIFFRKWRIFKKKSENFENKISFFTYLLENSLFILLDDLLMDDIKKKEKRKKKKNSKKCFGILTNLKKCFSCLVNCFKKIYTKISMFLLLRTKYICFSIISIGFFFYTIIQIILFNLTSVCIKSCIIHRVLNYLLFICLTIENNFFIFTIIFITSLLSTKREFHRIKENSKRAYLLYYHIKKALIFSIFLLIFHWIIAINFFYETKFSQALEMILLSLIRNIVFLTLIRLKNSKDNNSIEDDDENLKAENIFFAINNFLLHSMPNTRNIINILNKISKKTMKRNSSSCIFEEQNVNLCDKSIDFKNELKFELEQICINADENLEENLKIIKNQKYQSVIKTNGKSAYLNVWLLYFIIGDFMLSIFNYFLFLIFFSQMKPHSLYVFSTILKNILTLVEFTILPILIFKITQYENFFGNKKDRLLN